MLDLKTIREQPELVRERLRVRGRPEHLDAIARILELDDQRRRLITEVDALKAERNAVSPRVAELKRAARNSEADALIRQMRELGDRIAALDSQLAATEQPLRDALLELPNLPHPSVPAGDERENVVLRVWGEERTHDFAPRPHWEIGERLGILDLPRGAKITGSGFPVYVGAGARLERTLINFMIELHAGEHGYTEVWPPLLVNRGSALGTGHLPKFGADMYDVPGDELYLVPTAEVPVTNLHAGELLGPDQLPIRYVAYTPCFRREAGAHGKDTRGLIRLHQFDKVELDRLERPERAEDALEELTGHAEEVLRRLGLRYRVVLLAGGDLGFANAKTYDLEVWAPGIQRWLEVSSCSLYTDYQCRRAEIRFRPEPRGKPEYPHSLNGSALALPRTLIALLETYQTSDGAVTLPDVVAARMGAARLS